METNLPVLVLQLYSALNNKLKNIILRRKLYVEKLNLCRKNPRKNSKIINKNPVFNLPLTQAFVDVYYCNNVSLSQNYLCTVSFYP